MCLGLPRVFPSLTLLLASSSKNLLLLNASILTLFTEFTTASNDGIVRYDNFTCLLFRIFFKFEPSGKQLSNASKKALSTAVSGATLRVYTGLNQIIRRAFLSYHVSHCALLSSHFGIAGVRIRALCCRVHPVSI